MKKPVFAYLLALCIHLAAIAGADDASSTAEGHMGCKVRLTSRSGQFLNAGAFLLNEGTVTAFSPDEVYSEDFDARTGIHTGIALGARLDGNPGSESELVLVRSKSRLPEYAIVGEQATLGQLKFDPRRTAKIARNFGAYRLVVECESLGSSMTGDAYKKFYSEHVIGRDARHKGIHLVSFEAKGLGEADATEARAQLETGFGREGGRKLDGNRTYRWMDLGMEIERSSFTEKEKCGPFKLFRCKRRYDRCAIEAQVAGPYVPHVRGPQTVAVDARSGSAQAGGLCRTAVERLVQVLSRKMTD